MFCEVFIDEEAGEVGHGFRRYHNSCHANSLSGLFEHVHEI
jgi:hypothetical protein